MSRPKRITSYEDLVRAIARIQFYNPEYSLFFRGQAREYTLDSGATSMYPAIYRFPDGPLSANELLVRAKKLSWAQAQLLVKFRQNNLVGYNRLTQYNELCWAVLQHYEVCDTPLLDVTSSLQAAASFALRHDPATGILYVLGFPHINGSISYYVDDDLLNIKLLSICPPDAQRPYFQEGYLVGTLPARVSQKRASLDVACRLIAKFRIGWGKPETHWDFWGKNYRPIPGGAFFPANDSVEEICNAIKADLDDFPEEHWQEVEIPEHIVAEDLVVP